MIGNSIRCLNCKSDVVVPGLFPVPLFVCCLRLPPDRMFIVRLSLYRTNLLSQECIHMVIKSKFVLFFFSINSREPFNALVCATALCATQRAFIKGEISEKQDQKRGE